MVRYVVTDLTRFSNQEIVCTAVVNAESGECLRPMPYLQSSRVEELNIHPGAILEGKITPNQSVNNPHIEDASYRDLTYVGPTSGDDFQSILDKTLSNSVASGFGITLAANQKHIPTGQQATCSIVTVKVQPSALNIHEDQYKPGKIKASFADGAGHSYRYLSITDRGFFDYAKKHQNDGQLAKVKKFISTQKEVYLRIGLSRQFTSPDGRDGYWLQVNGIYTFPDYFEEVRAY